MKKTEMDLIFQRFQYLKTEDIFPFVNEMVETFYNDQCNSLISKSIENDQDKSTFMMFIMMYFGIHLKLETKDDDTKKAQIKMLLTELIRDPEKRRYCIEVFQNKFNNLFSESSSENNKNLLKNNK
jgi:hypothetical protein